MANGFVAPFCVCPGVKTSPGGTSPSQKTNGKRDEIWGILSKGFKKKVDYLWGFGWINQNARLFCEPPMEGQTLGNLLLDGISMAFLKNFDRETQIYPPFGKNSKNGGSPLTAITMRGLGGRGLDLKIAWLSGWGRPR